MANERRTIETFHAFLRRTCWCTSTPNNDVSPPVRRDRTSVFRSSPTLSVDRSLDTKFDLTVDLQQVLDEDLALLHKQNETLKLDQLHGQLKHLCERLDKASPTDRVLSLPFFTGPNRSCGNAFEPFLFSRSVHQFCLDAELVRPSADSTFRLLKNYEKKILSIDLHHLLPEVSCLALLSVALVRTKSTRLDGRQRDQSLRTDGADDHLDSAAPGSSSATRLGLFRRQPCRATVPPTACLRRSSTFTNTKRRDAVRRAWRMLR